MSKGALLDANLLCLLVVGRTDSEAIALHPRLKAFGADDYEKLGLIIDRTGDPVFCPHILTETSNLLGFRQTPAQLSRWRDSLAALVDLFTERTQAAGIAVSDPVYDRLGLADAILLLLATDTDLTLVSDDLHLCLEAEHRGLRTVNYNYVRDGALRINQL